MARSSMRSVLLPGNVSVRLANLGLVSALWAAAGAQAQSWQGVMMAAGRDVYFIQDSKRLYIPDPKYVQCLGDWGKVVYVDASLLNSFPNGSSSKTDCTHPASSVLLFQYSFEGENRESNHVHATIRADDTGFVGGWFVYDNDNFGGFCGGIIVAVYDSAGKELKTFTPPSGCIQGKGETFSSHAIFRKVEWQDRVDAAPANKIARLEVRYYVTHATDKLPSPEQVEKALSVAASVVALIL